MKNIKDYERVEVIWLDSVSYTGWKKIKEILLTAYERSAGP